MLVVIADISLREIKKARAKIALYEASLSLMEDKMFHEVMLEDICRQAEVSRVTFFKFFPKKEDVLVYFMRVWLTERIIEIEQEKKMGFDAIRHLLYKVAEQTKVTPGILPSLISFLAEMRMHPHLQELTEAEVCLLFPDHEEIGSSTPDLYKIFHTSMEYAEKNGTLKEGISLDRAVKVLFTIFYGSFLTAQQYASTDIIGFYEIHLQLLEKG
ncbi:TetR/AcrR family transcriptional regulator [Paenibacillus pinisoli]|uniref:TetR/AcrR family transcriptional regulator n=1 Tax=Paenibacillus pinisoli TaxID=1276110 RepID=A0A3A6PGD2_9BACL|nr:TetR/AcrR family transcriptional regulator [Paenibacillus pinisoli]RJX39280.1 TetR/AcrR family transcriptional regulator [Paenibacillus pinisoli]